MRRIVHPSQYKVQVRESPPDIRYQVQVVQCFRETADLEELSSDVFLSELVFWVFKVQRVDGNNLTVPPSPFVPATRPQG